MDSNNRKNVQKILRYSKKYLIWAIVAIVATVAFSLFEVFKANTLKQIVDAAQSGNMDGILPLFINGLCAILAIVIVVFMSRYSAGRFAANVLHDIKRDSAKHISNMPLGYMSNNRTGEILSKMSTDANTIQGFMEGDFIQLMQMPFTILFYTIYLLWLSPLLFVVCFISLPILVPLGASFATPFKRGSKKYMEYLGRVSNTVQDMAGGIALVKSYNLEDTLADKYNSGIQRATDMALHNDKYQYKGSFMFTLARNIPTLTCLIFGGYLCLKGSISLGALISFSTLIGQLLTPLMRASAMFFNLKIASASAERVFSIINEPKEESGGADCGLSETAPIIEFKDVHFSYEEGTSVLNGLNLSIEKGKTTGFAGASGCGKSTVLGLICGFYKPDSGRILLKGRDMTDWDLKAMRAQISYVSQSSYLFPVSIYENIAMGKEGARRDEVINAAKLAYAHNFISEFPDGYDTQVGERGCRLSGGQMQRIAIARAILKNAPILLLDEATSALDVKAEAEVQRAIDNLSRGKTVLVVAHRLSTIQNADRIVVIDGGVLKESGTHDELVSLNGIYSSLHNLSAQVEGGNENDPD